MIYLENYLSLWIANLGVVPLLSLAFFLFLPLDLTLFFLILFVFNVLEPIFLTFVKLLNLKQYFVTFLIYIVKVFFTLITLFNHSSYAKEMANKDIFIAIGEQRELSIKNLKSFSVGNKAVITTKYFAPSQQLLIKGKSIGFSDIVIWQKNGEKIKFHLYVISKKEQLSKLQAVSGFNKINLTSTAINNNFLIEGELHNIKDYLIYKSLMKENKVISQVTLSRDLIRSLITKAYIELNNELSFINCNYKEDNINCYVKSTELTNNNVKLLSKNYFINFYSTSNINLNTNYQVSLKIIKVEKSNINDLNLGTHKLEGTLRDLIKNHKNLYKNNSVLIEDGDIFAKVIATPSITISPNQIGKIELGAQTPFVTANQYSTNTQWKFSGLKLAIKLIPDNGRFKLNIKNELTAPQGSGISGSKVEQVIFTKMQTQQIAFKLDLTSSIDKSNSMPLINTIPIIKELFSTKEVKNSNTNLIGFLQVEEINE